MCVAAAHVEHARRGCAGPGKRVAVNSEHTAIELRAGRVEGQEIAAQSTLCVTYRP
jgi:hypothetical protein